MARERVRYRAMFNVVMGVARNIACMTQFCPVWANASPIAVAIKLVLT